MPWSSSAAWPPTPTVPVHIFSANVLNQSVHTSSPPAGRAFLVTDIDVFFTGGVAGGSVNLELMDGRTFYQKSLTAASPSESDHWSGFHWLGPGEYFVVNVANGPFDVTIDGLLVPWSNL